MNNGAAVRCWRWLTTSRYTRRLEAETELLRSEIARLREENRALLNSLLVRGGFAPLEEWEPKPANAAMPRRLSWQQESRRREIEATRELVRKEAAKEAAKLRENQQKEG